MPRSNDVRMPVGRRAHPTDRGGMLAASDQFVEQTTSAALEEKAKLQKHFNRFDIYFFLICTIVGVDTLGQVAQNGAQGFLWLLILAVVFFVPYALLTAELGRPSPRRAASTSGRGWHTAA